MFQEKELEKNWSDFDDYIKKISDEDKDSIERAITLEEIEEAIKQAPKNKSPGPDGFPAEFYGIFEIKGQLLKVFNTWLNEGIEKKNALSYIRILAKEGGEKMDDLNKTRAICL